MLGLGHKSLGTWLKVRHKVAKAMFMALFQRLGRANKNLSDLVFLAFTDEQKSIK